jgi:hypothetical protein
LPLLDFCVVIVLCRSCQSKQFVDWGGMGQTTAASTGQNVSMTFLIDHMPDVWAELRSVATEVRGLAPAILGVPPPHALEVTATGADDRKPEGGGDYSTWTSMDVSLFQHEDSLVVIVVNTLPRPMVQVAIDLSPLTETLLGPNATAAVDVGRTSRPSYTLEMVDWLVTDGNFGVYEAHHYTFQL